MKWEIKNKPEIGDIKTKIKIAFLPTIAKDKINNKFYWIWLCKYISIEEYKIYTSYMPDFGKVNVIGWKTIEKNIF